LNGIIANLLAMKNQSSCLRRELVIKNRNIEYFAEQRRQPDSQLVCFGFGFYPSLAGYACRYVRK
jgi:hypothetical protein